MIQPMLRFPREDGPVTSKDRTTAPTDETHEDWVPPTWGEIVEQHGERVYRLAYRLTGNVHEAEDLTHDTFVRVFRSLDRYTPGTFEGWLHRITTNLFLDRARRKQRLRFDSLTDEFAALLHSGTATPEDVYVDHLLDADIQEALDELQPQYRAAVVLSDIEGLTYEEVAEALGIKLGTVRSRIHRGRAQLRESLGHRAPTRQRGDSGSRRRGGGSGFPVARPVTGTL